MSAPSCFDDMSNVDEFITPTKVDGAGLRIPVLVYSQAPFKGSEVPRGPPKRFCITEILLPSNVIIVGV